MRRRDAPLPVAILLSLPSPLSPPLLPPPSTLTLVFLAAILYLSAGINCCTTSPTHSVDRTDTTERSQTNELVSDATVTTSGDRLILLIASSGDVVDVKSQMTTEHFGQSTPTDVISDADNQFPQMSTQSLGIVTANNRQFWSSAKPEVTTDDVHVSATSYLYVSTLNDNRNLLTTSQSFSSKDVRQSVQTANTFSAGDNMLDDFSTTVLSDESTTTASPVFDKRTDVSGTREVTSAAASVTQNGVKSTVESRLDRVDSIGAEHFITNTSNTRWRRLIPPNTATSSNSGNRTAAASRIGERKRCLRMLRTGGGDSWTTDCQRQSGDDWPSGQTTDRRRHLEFCDAYSAYVAELDCASSSLCLDVLCPEVARLDRLAQSMNEQFIDRILNYDCDNRYSGVWNCSACKVSASRCCTVYVS